MRRDIKGWLLRMVLDSYTIEFNGGIEVIVEGLVPIAGGWRRSIQ